MCITMASRSHMWYTHFFFLGYYLKWLSFVLLPLLHVDVIRLIETGEIVLAFSCPVTPNYPILVLSHLFSFFCLFFFFFLSVFWMRKNISIKIWFFPGAKWLGYTPGCTSNKERFWTISNFYKANISLYSREMLYTRTRVPSQFYSLFLGMTALLNVALPPEGDN